ncbi:MAG: carbon-nitrogen hydrolase family protein [Coriobacteriia bacterium]|nr:carbon-nitrogen hydrolase family protein [Coriobacteriia bacterium]
MVFPEDAFFTTEEYANEFLSDAAKIAKENNINILLPVLRIQQEGKNINTLNLINREGKLLNTYTKNHLVPVVEEPTTQKGDGKTPVIEIDGIKITYLICADFTSNQLAYNGTEADIFLNPSYDWEIFQYFTSYAVQARAIECGFATLRNPVNGNIILYDSNGRPMHMSNAMDVHEGILYMDVPCDGKQTIYDTIGNVFP